MELDHFLESLKNSLVDRGIPPEAAAKHVAALGRTFTADDLTEIQGIRSPAEIEEIADSIAEILYKNQAARAAAKAEQKPPETTAPPQSASTPTSEPMAPVVPTVESEKVSPHISEEKVVRTPSSVETYPQREPSYGYGTPQPQQRSADFFQAPSGRDKTTRGVAIFWSVFIVTLPITLTLLLVILALFGAAFLGIILAIIGLVAGMIGVVAAGCGLALVGIIYGITQLFSFMAAGLYEIGLGVMISGGALLSGVILYNLAIRFLPWVMKWLTVFFAFVFHRLRDLFYLARRECYKL